MGAEGKYDLKLAPGYEVSNAGTSAVMTSRKSSSTPSLPETCAEVKPSVASTDQAASADNLAAKQAAEAIAESVLSVARAEAIVAVTQDNSQTPTHADLSAINTGSSDLATIVETLTLSDQPGSNRSGLSTQPPQTPPIHKDALDRIREGTDLLRNNTNSFLSGLMAAAQLAPAVRISTAGVATSTSIAQDSTESTESPSVTTNPMSVSVPNLVSVEQEGAATAGLLETFAAMARRRTNPTNNQSSVGSTTSGGGLFPRGPNCVSSLVRLALSSNFPGGLLSTAQSYPSLSAERVPGSAGVHNSGAPPPMSLTSSSDSEQVSLEDFLGKIIFSFFSNFFYTRDSQI